MRNYHARLVIYDLPKFSKKELRLISKWLVKQSKEILKNKDFAVHYTARIMK